MLTKNDRSVRVQPLSPNSLRRKLEDSPEREPFICKGVFSPACPLPAPSLPGPAWKRSSCGHVRGSLAAETLPARKRRFSNFYAPNLAVVDVSFRPPAQREARLLPWVLGAPEPVPAWVRRRCPAPAGPAPLSLLAWPGAARDGAAWASSLGTCALGQQFGWVPPWRAACLDPPDPRTSKAQGEHAVLENKASREDLGEAEAVWWC